jgi:hypothetical protein
MSVLADRLIAVHDALTAARLPHAFGGAIALAYCTEEPRGTRDLDVNIFVSPARAKDVFQALPAAVRTGAAELRAAQREGQVRLWWEDTPIDVFLDVHRFHRDVATGVCQVPFMERSIPVLGCTALAVFKALFNRTKDWADIEAMAEAGSLDVGDAAQRVEHMAGADHPGVQRLQALSL